LKRDGGRKGRRERRDMRLGEIRKAARERVVQGKAYGAQPIITVYEALNGRRGDGLRRRAFGGVGRVLRYGGGGVR
jgi:hypothetical protein